VFPAQLLLRYKIIGLLWVLLCALAAQAQQAGVQEKDSADAAARLLRQSLNTAMAGKPGAAVVVDVESGKIIAQHGMETAARRLATPGSTVKPFVLMALLKSQKFSSDEAFFCRRTLRIAGKRMDCTHPQLAAPLHAEEALAYSCNSYFAAMAERISAADLVSALQHAGFTSPTGWSRDEVTGTVRETQTLEQRQLQALGEEDVKITPLELLAAYRIIALQHRREDKTWEVIYRGLQDSTTYGMAHAAAPDGYNVAGKTGTANSSSSAFTHGWFAGYAPTEKPEIALVVYLEHGRGSDAAAVARMIFTAYGKLKGGH
jgi:cell division protein FtsI/penicillin-binding protein 2